MRSAELEAYIAALTPNPAFAELFRRHGLRYRWLAMFTIVTGNIAAVLSGTMPRPTRASASRLIRVSSS